MYAQDLGATKQEVGWIMGGFAIGLLGSRVWAGNLVDRRGRKIALLIGATVVGLAPLGYLITQPIWPLLGMRTFHGVCLATYTTGYNALVVDLSPPQQRGELLGYMSLAIPLGMGLGPAGGAFLAEATSYQLLFIISALLGFGSLALASLVPDSRVAPSEDSVSNNQGDEDRSPRSFIALLASQALLIPALVMLLIGLLFGNLATFLPLFTRELSLESYAGFFYSTAAIASFFPRILLGPLADRYGRGGFITSSLLLYLLSMICLTHVHSPAELLIAAALEGAGSGMLIPMMIALVADRSSPQERGRVFSVCMGGFDGGIAIAAPIMGYLNQGLGHRSVFSLTGGLAITALVLFCSLSNPTVSRSWRFALWRGKDYFATPQTLSLSK